MRDKATDPWPCVAADSTGNAQAPDSHAPDHWTASTTRQLLATLGTGPEGLSVAEARRRLRRHGMNALRRKREWPLVLHFLARFTQPMLLVLLAAAGVSAMLGDLTSFALIVSMVVLSVALDFFQEHRAGRAAEALEQSVALVARTLRDGRAVPTPVTRLVPGDVVLLSAGGVV
ncbi:MAG TPA: cation-transporting P-type ATPase, partial [Burkholderiaceae bacterium]